jgi:hypothetical protein
MPRQTRVFYIGIVGISGKGADFVENYNPDRTIGEIVAILKSYNLASGKQIKIWKHKFGDISKYDSNDPYWSENTKLSDYCTHYGGYSGDVELIYCVI